MVKKYFIIILFIFNLSIFCQVNTGNNFRQQNQQKTNNLELINIKNEVRYEYQEYISRVKPFEGVSYNTQSDGFIKFNVKNGQLVKNGDLLFSVSKDSGSYLPKSRYSNLSGVIDGIVLKNGDLVGSGKDVLKIIDVNKLKIPLYISDKVIGIVGEEKTLKAYIFENENKVEFDIVKDKISLEPDYVSGLFEAEYTLSKKISIGATVYIKIPYKKLEGIFVKKDLLMREYGQNYLLTVKDDVINRVKVQIVNSLDDEVMVSGLEEGVSIPNSRRGLKVGDKFSQMQKQINEALNKRSGK